MPMPKRLGAVVVCVLAVTLAGCGKKGDQKQASQSPQPAPAAKTQAAAGEAAPSGSSMPDYAKTAEQNRPASAQMNQGKVVEAVSGATLKELLPAELPGMKRTSASGERNQMMGVDVSSAEGQYEATDGQDASVYIRITDIGGVAGPTRTGMTSWATMQYNQETDTGYQKTTTFNGYKAVEQYRTQAQSGTLHVWVADRFIVEIGGEQMSMDALKEMGSKLDFKKLAAAGS
jgi:negative regulator of sigma E activity